MGYPHQQPARATSTEELRAVLDRFFDEESYEKGLKWHPRPSDVIISPYAKCGTTWLQQIAHGLRTRGSMDFEEITNVTPWIEVAYDVGWDLEAPQSASPRLFKSHLNYHDIPKGARYIVSFRNPENALVSFYRFFEGWMFEPGTIDLETLFRWRWPRERLGEIGYWYHMRSWLSMLGNEDVLLLCYENMRADLPRTVERIARFMGIDLDQELLEIVLHQSSREFMLAHKEQFTDHLINRIGSRRANLPAPIEMAKITPGASRDARYRLSQALRDELDEIWREQDLPGLGFERYEDLRAALA